VPRKAQKKKKERNWTNCPCASAHGHFCPLSSPIFSFQFFLHFGEKTYRSHYLFCFLPTQLNTLQKVFLPIFFPKFSIHSISSPNKTHPKTQLLPSLVRILITLGPLGVYLTCWSRMVITYSYCMDIGSVPINGPLLLGWARPSDTG